ncbi:FecR domain-containing protein [Reichenbachiella sp. MALMAid0571]|uniref:FecR family protein n=1 Tax=Reichenbachiella sp. MALMAid0571 TaxID=3143939 RepID=UPI0032DF79A0
MNNYHDLDDIISKKLSEGLSEKEQAVFESWLEGSSENKKEFEYLSKIWKEKSREPKLINSELKARNIWDQAKNGSKGTFEKDTPINFYRYFKIAAMIVVVLGIAFFTYRFSVPNQQKTVEIASDEIVRSSSPSGSKTRVALPDGSIAWLNSDSYVEFPRNFTNDARIVDLVGEAYFEVRKDSLRPFTVRSFGANTTALGTSFNISAFPENEIVDVHLITGKVLVNNVVLRPGEGASFDRKNEFIKVSQIDTDQVLGWKDGILLFDGDNFQTFIKKLERWYGLDITVNGKPNKTWSVKGRFEKEYLTNVLQAVGFNKAFTYKLDDKKLEINF